MSLALYVQCAVFSHGAVLLLVLFLLVVGFCINGKEGDFKKMIATPMYMVFPMHFSKFGLSAPQQNRVKFYASSVAVRLLCCVAFWGVFWTQLEADLTGGQGCSQYWGLQYSSDDCGRMPAFLVDACNLNLETSQREKTWEYFSPHAYESCLNDRSLLLQNICITQACQCQIFIDFTQTWETSSSHFAPVWETVVAIILYFPSTSLALWLFCSLILPQVLGLAQYFSCYDGVFWMLGTAQQNPIMRDKIHHQSKQLATQIAQEEVKASCKQRLQLHLEFFLLLLDVVTDLNCLVQLLRSKQYEVAIIQACAILLPILVDWYRSRGRSFQMVEVVKGFMASRKVGFHTDDYMLALQSEKGLEAPLSFMIQYYTVFRLTDSVSFYSVWCSIPLSIYSMSKFVYVQFEFCIVETIEKKTEELNKEANSAKNQPSQPFFQGFLPQSFGCPKVLDTE